MRPLRHIAGEVDFNEVFLDGAVVPDDQRVGEVGDGWKVANATLSGERQMVSGAGSGGVDRIGGRGIDHVDRPRASQRRCAPIRSSRQELMRVYSEERIRDWTNQRVRAAGEGRPLARSRRARSARCTRAGSTSGSNRSRSQSSEPAPLAWDGDASSYAAALPPEVRGMLRSRANTIEGGTTEVNKNIVGERVLGLPARARPVQARARGARSPAI